MMTHRFGLERRLITSDPDSLNSRPRLRVDIGQTSFFEGREFRTFFEFNIASGATAVLKYVSTVNFVLSRQELNLDDGKIRLSVVASGGTEGGTFSTALPIIGRNRMSERPTPNYASQVAVSTGGTHTGGIEVEVIRLVTSNATAQQISVGSSVSDERGLPAGTYYVRLNNFGSGDATGTYNISWEERP